MEQEVKDKLNDFEKQLERTNIKIDGLETRMNGAETSIKLINQNLQTVIDNTSEIKKTIDRNNTEMKIEIKELAKKREEDHYIKPMANTEKLKFQAIGIAMGIFISAFLMYLFPVIK